MKTDDVLDEIAANFEFEGWTVTKIGGGALLLERDGTVYPVEVHQS